MHVYTEAIAIPSGNKQFSCHGEQFSIHKAKVNYVALQEILSSANFHKVLFLCSLLVDQTPSVDAHLVQTFVFIFSLAVASRSVGEKKKSA